MKNASTQGIYETNKSLVPIFLQVKCFQQNYESIEVYIIVGRNIVQYVPGYDMICLLLLKCARLQKR